MKRLFSDRLLGASVASQIWANDLGPGEGTDIEEGSTTVEYAIGAIATT